VLLSVPLALVAARLTLPLTCQCSSRASSHATAHCPVAWLVCLPGLSQHCPATAGAAEKQPLLNGGGHASTKSVTSEGAPPAAKPTFTAFRCLRPPAFPPGFAWAAQVVQGTRGPMQMAWESCMTGALLCMQVEG
jgi:hypothetical protein